MLKPAKSALRITSAKAVKSCHSAAHTSHMDSIPRLKRIRGQLEGVDRMITENRYCVDILTQIKATRSALQALENEVLARHLESCVREAISSKDPFQASKKIQELTELLAR